jgi:hypothetical protein
MAYHQQQPIAPHHHMNHYGSHFPPQSIIPDASSSNEKAMMWPGSSYMSPPESGYSTRAASVSSFDTFQNNEKNDSASDTATSNLDDTGSTISAAATANTTVTQSPQVQAAPLPQPAQYTQLQPAHEQQPAAELEQSAENGDVISDWINYQDNSEMAIKAIPDLLKLLVDEDLVIVQQAAILLNQISCMEVPRLGLIQSGNAVQCLVDCLNKTLDLDTARSLVGSLYGISTQKTHGVQALVNSKALSPLINIIS